MLTVREYVDESGRSPFRNWLTTLDQAVRARVQARILRFELGNLGDHKQVGGGVWEARLAFGPGYKGSQRKDIKRAQDYWAKYLKETQRGTKK